MTSKASEFVPLTPLWFNILLAMSDQTQHGYALIKEIEARSGGVIRPTAGGTYLALGRLVDRGLIVESEAGDPGQHQGPTRRLYSLTVLGREVVALEATRIASEVGDAIRKGVIDASAVKS